ncbi:MAG: DUF2249 domain-containing protein [Chloroflexi bacterium CFX4]|nr:DUF2249 domain-containing protein [Chloroflexi bacterium CFX4]MDL1923932.1 DUF2249 domain-containing protein [Chloroflexi bacterium CFX3]
MSETQTTYMLDVRAIAPRERHPRIFALLDALKAGEALILTNDHAPEPLRSHLTLTRPNQFDWEYLEDGPQVWRVQIVRRAEPEGD